MASKSKKLSKMAPPSADEMDMGYEDDFAVADDVELADEEDDMSEEELPEIDPEEAEKHLAKLEEMGLDVQALRDQLGGGEEEGEEEDDYNMDFMS